MPVSIEECYLVDPASSHMLVSKIKPCMSKYKPLDGETANGSINQLWFLRSTPSYLDNCGNSRANTCTRASTAGFRARRRGAFIRSKPVGAGLSGSRTVPILVTLDNFTPIARPSRRRRIFQMSALSTVDGRLRAYHGCNG